MNPSQIDSLKILQQSNDSLKKIINERTILNIYESPVQASLIIATGTVVTVILGFIFKDFLIPGWIERRSKRREAEYLFAKYKTQLFGAALHFEKRLHEIYRTRSHYLWTQTSMSSFYDYKYKSSVYRLCVLLGWMRAFKLLEVSMTINKSDENLIKIGKTIKRVESCFADGQNVEMYVAKAICNLADIDAENLNKDILVEFSIEIDDLVQSFQTNNKTEYIADLSTELKDKFVDELVAVMLKLRLVSAGWKPVKKSEIIKEVSIKLALIYRDWQQAIGDLMLTKNSDGSFDVISFRTFEKMWNMKSEDEEKVWLKRAERIFEKLDMRVDKNSDSRIEQLGRVYNEVYQMMAQLYKTNVGPKPISEKDFAEIPKNIEYYP